MSELRTDIQPPAEQLAIRAKCFHPSGRFEEFTKGEVEQSIPERFKKMVNRYPDRIAIKEGAEAITYTELNQRANRLAHAILDRCGERNLPVAILMEHSTSVLVAIFAVLKAGKIYVPLDPSYPLERLQYMLFDSQAEVVVAHRGTLSLARQMGSEDVPVIDTDAVGAGSRHDDVSMKITPEACASIFYTSGSTGQPKGVVDNHRNLLHGTLRFTNGLHICAEDRLSFTHSCSASASVRRIFPALLNGACLFPLDLKRQGIRALVDLVVSESITALGIGRIRDLVGSFSQHQSFPSLRLVSLGGETLYRRDVELYKKIFPRDCLIGILMSSTEAGNITQFFIDRDTQLAGEIAPIGYPAEDVEIMLLDDRGHPVRPGEIGEITVKSKYLACGYWRRPRMTDERFCADPAGGEQRIYRTGDLGRAENEGCLFHMGRKDDQVKVRGHRVEIAEIEAALLNLGYFRKAIVILREGGSDEKSLVAYLEPEKRLAPTSSTLRKALAATLPDHMIPSRFVMLETIPLTATEKVNRNALPEPGSARPEMDSAFIAPRTLLERDIAKIWEDVLSLDQVGVYDNFLDLGGHSLAAFRVICQVIQTFRIDLSPKALFDSPTVAEMAVVIETNLSKLATQEELDRILIEVEVVSNEETKRATEVGEAKSETGEHE